MNRLLHTRHAVPWMAVGVAAAPGAVLLLVALGFKGQVWAPALAINGLLLLALPAAFLLDDPASPVVGATPRSPWWDLSSRLLALLLLCSLVATTAWTWHQLSPSPQPWLLALIPVSLALASVAGGAVLRRAGRARPGDAMAGALVFAILGLSLFRPSLKSWELMPNPGTADPQEVSLWICAAALSILTIAWAPSGRGTRTAVDV